MVIWKKMLKVIMLKVNNLKFKKISYIDRFVPVIVVPYLLDTFDC